MSEQGDAARSPADGARTTAPCGSWSSPVTARLIAEGGVGTMWPQSVDQSLYWVELRPTEEGRYVVVRRSPDGETADVTPAGISARTLVHEYGGGMYTAFRGVDGGESVVFCDQADQRLYRQDLRPAGGASPASWTAPRPVTSAPPRSRAHRYADGRVTPDGRLLVSVRERHEADDEVVNELVSLPADGTAEPRVVASGHDFYAAPRISPDGRRLAWLCWDHPRMPWDGTELWMAELAGDGSVSGERLVAGGPDESVIQPLWSPSGELWFASDRTGWWNLYAVDVRRQPTRRARMPASRNPARSSPGRPSSPRLPGSSACRATCSSPTAASSRTSWRTAAAASRCSTRPAARRTDEAPLRELDTPYTVVYSLTPLGDRAGMIAATSHRGLAGGRPRARRRQRRPRGRSRRSRPPGPARPDRPGVHQPPGAHSLPHGGRPHGARQLLPADEPGLRRAGRANCRRCWSTSTAARPRRTTPSSTWTSSTGPRAASPWSM